MAAITSFHAEVLPLGKCTVHTQRQPGVYLTPSNITSKLTSLPCHNSASEMTYTVSGGALNSTQSNPKP